MGCAPAKDNRQTILEANTAFYVPRKVRHAQDDGHVRIITKKGLKYTHQRFVNQKQPSLLTMIPQNDKSIDQFFCCYNKMMALFDDHDIDNAYEAAMRIKNKHNSKLLSIDPTSQSKQSRQINRVIREYRTIEESYQEIYSEGWVQKSNKKGVKISTRKQGTNIAVMTESIVQSPFEVTMATLHQSIHLKQFMPYVYQSKQINSFQRNIRIGYTVAKIPFMSNRESHFQTGVYKRFDSKKCIVLFTRSIDDKPELLEEFQYKPKINPKAVQLYYKYFILKYQPLDKNKGKITMAMNADMKIGNIPDFLMEIGTEIFGNKIFQSISNNYKNWQGSRWQKSVKARPELYTWANRAIQDYLEDKDSKTTSRSNPIGANCKEIPTQNGLKAVNR